MGLVVCAMVLAEFDVSMSTPCNLTWFIFFFFKQKTAYEMRISDWSSDVCSSVYPAALATSQSIAHAEHTTLISAPELTSTRIAQIRQQVEKATRGRDRKKLRLNNSSPQREKQEKPPSPYNETPGRNLTFRKGWPISQLLTYPRWTERSEGKECYS